MLYHRSEIQARVSGKGKMLAVGISEEEAQTLLKGVENKVSIATINGPEMLTISGETQELESIAAQLVRRGIFNRFVKVDVPYHSRFMEEIRQDLILALDKVKGKTAKIPLYSTVSGKRELGNHIDENYWYRNVREPVCMTRAIESMLSDGFDFFIEIGPHPVLVSGAEALFKKLEHISVAYPSMNRKEPEYVTLNKLFGRLIAHGYSPNLNRLFGSDCRYVKLPKNPWQRERYWFEMPDIQQQRLEPYQNPFLRSQTRLVAEEGLGVWHTNINTKTFPFLEDYQIDGEIVVPAPAHLETAYAAANHSYHGIDIFLENIQLHSALILPQDTKFPLDIRLEITSNEGDYEMCSRSLDAKQEIPWTKHSKKRIVTILFNNHLL